MQCCLYNGLVPFQSRGELVVRHEIISGPIKSTEASSRRRHQVDESIMGNSFSNATNLRVHVTQRPNAHSEMNCFGDRPDVKPTTHIGPISEPCLCVQQSTSCSRSRGKNTALTRPRCMAHANTYTNKNSWFPFNSGYYRTGADQMKRTSPVRHVTPIIIQLLLHFV